MSTGCKIVTCDTTPNRGFTGPTGPGGGEGASSDMLFSGILQATDISSFLGNPGPEPVTSDIPFGYPFADDRTIEALTVNLMGTLTNTDTIVFDVVRFAGGTGPALPLAGFTLTFSGAGTATGVQTVAPTAVVLTAGDTLALRATRTNSEESATMLVAASVQYSS